MCIISLTELTEAQAKEVWAAELAQQAKDILRRGMDYIPTAEAPKIVMPVVEGEWL